MPTLTNDPRLFERWMAIKKALRARGMSESISCKRDLGPPPDRSPWALVRARCNPDGPAPTAEEIGLIFSENGMTAVEFMPDDGYSISGFYILIHPAERIESLLVSPLAMIRQL
jgi:hypothetical protein